MNPITDLMKKKEFQWTLGVENAFVLAENLLSKAPCLALPDFNILFEVDWRPKSRKEANYIL